VVVLDFDVDDVNRAVKLTSASEEVCGAQVSNHSLSKRKADREEGEPSMTAS
jgi:hypothetical protein